MQRRFANPVPLGCCAFALTSFVFNCTNLYMIGKGTPSIDIGVAMTYGGIVQVLAGMWYEPSHLNHTYLLLWIED